MTWPPGACRPRSSRCRGPCSPGQAPIQPVRCSPLLYPLTFQPRPGHRRRSGPGHRGLGGGVGPELHVHLGWRGRACLAGAAQQGRRVPGAAQQRCRGSQAAADQNLPPGDAGSAMHATLLGGRRRILLRALRHIVGRVPAGTVPAQVNAPGRPMKLRGPAAPTREALPGRQARRAALRSGRPKDPRLTTDGRRPAPLPGRGRRPSRLAAVSALA
jgi:hypothetical protein